MSPLFLGWVGLVLWLPIAVLPAWAMFSAPLVAQHPGRFPPTNNGGRNDLCPLTLAGWGGLAVWSDRPLFLWQGSGSRLVVRDRETNNILWEQTLNENQQQILYAGQPLQPGRRYSWQLEPATVNPRAPRQDYQFVLLGASDRDSITQELTRLETQLRQQGANPSAIAARQIEYFISKDLISDAVRVLFTTPNPSPDLVQDQRQVMQTCSSGAASPTAP